MVAGCFAFLLPVSTFHCVGDDANISNVWTGAWAKRTTLFEQQRLQTPNVRLLVITLFVDKTALDALGRNTACPMMMTLLNYTMDLLVQDNSKKVAFFYPDMYLTKEQRKDKAVKRFMRGVYNWVTEKFMEELLKLYNRGGFEFVTPDGEVYYLVPVVAFAVTDMEEAKQIKGLYQGYNARMPCILCKVKFGHANIAFYSDELELRNAKEDARLINRYLKYDR